MRRALLLTLAVTAPPLLAAECLGAALLTAPVAAAETMTLEGHAFGLPLHVEIPAGPGAEAALRAVLAALRDAEAESDPDRGPLAALNASAGAPHDAPLALRTTLDRALAFCRWSDGTNGPLGGALYELWGLRARRAAMPDPDSLQKAVAAARCDGLALDDAKGTATLAAGARLDLWSFAAGAGLDRAVDALTGHGVHEASLTLGPIQRAIGEGPGGRGWPLRVEVPSVLRGFTTTVLLRDQAFAMATANDPPLRAGGESFPPYLDQRTGRPAGGVFATVAITDLALDAQALAATIFVTGTRRGGFLLGQLQPSPAALWVLGDGRTEPIVSDYHWGTRQKRGVP